METVDMVYIINKKQHFLNKDACIAQFTYTGITKYRFVDAIYPSSEYYTKFAYDQITKSMDHKFIKDNFSIGALGCLLSHIKVAKDAKEKRYKQIIVLEGDFILSKSFLSTFAMKLASLKNNWDFIYLGKKQGTLAQFQIVESIHDSQKYFKNVLQINQHFNTTNYQTWGTHAIMYKNTVFQSIIDFEKQIIAPVDIMLMRLYNKYKFYVVSKDLFIADETSSDINNNKTNCTWGWDLNQYLQVTKTEIKHLIVIGFKNFDHHTHHYIHKMYFNFFAHYYPNLNVIWCETFDDVGSNISARESLILISPCHTSKKLHLPKEAFYIIHLDSPDNKPQTDDEMNSFFDNYQDLKKNNRYIVLTCRKGIYGLTYFNTCPKNRAICLPWFADNLYQEVYEVKQNLNKYYQMQLSKSYFCYFGSIWNLNVDIILELIEVFAKNGKNFILKGRIFGLDKQNTDYISKINSVYPNIRFEPFNYKQRDDYTNTFEYIDATYGVKALLPLQGREHNETYMSNRLFESLSRGYLAVTNCKIAKNTFQTVLYNEKISDLIANYIDLLNNKQKWIELMNKQIDEYLWKFYGYTNIKFLLGFLRETCERNLELPYFDVVNNSNYTLWIRSKKTTAHNRYFAEINNDTELRSCIQRCDQNYILYWSNDVYDLFLVDRLFSNPHLTIMMDETMELTSCEILQKLLKNREYSLKKKLDIFCLISGQRTGSTILIDILQKFAPTVLALSEIFFEYQKSYDITKGILKDELVNFIPLSSENREEYMQQFIDYAEYKNYDKFIFKWTIDFTHDIEYYTCLHHILNIVCKYNIIYLKRNDVMSYISKKLSEVHGYSNVVYQSIPQNLFSIVELNNMINNKLKFEKTIFDFFSCYKQICYKEGCTNSELVRLCENLLNIKINENEILCKNYIQLNTKQNPFPINQLFNQNHWR